MDWQVRTAETARLDRLATRREGAFGVLWGRRRVGKTRLLVEWVARRGGAYFVADESTPALQRRRFAEAMAAVVPGFDEVEYRRAAVDGLVLDPSGLLHDEPSRLLLEELPPAIGLRPILDTIGAGAHKVSEIAGRIGVPATSMARSMTRLVDLGLVVRETPFGEPERSTKRAVYKVADPFLRLWFSLVAPRHAMLARVDKKARLALFDERAPHLDAASWEDLCRVAVPRLETVLGASFGPAQRYWGGSGPEWDVVAQASGGRRRRQVTSCPRHLTCRAAVS